MAGLNFKETTTMRRDERKRLLRGSAPGTVERRFFGTEVRAEANGHIGGHAAVFDEEYVLYDSPTLQVVESVKPGTFSRALREKQDVRCLFNHNPDNVLGRTSAGTLEMKEDKTGLAFDCAPPETQLGRDVRVSIQRKDITGCSFSFIAKQQNRTEQDVAGKTVVRREIQDVDVFDVGPVTFPAYKTTDVSARELRAAVGHDLPDAVLARFDVPDGGPDDPSTYPAGEAEEQECRCRCRACYSGDCQECEDYMAECGDAERCGGATRAARAERDDKRKTKRVDGEDLPASSFLYVGDPDKTATWALPWKFSTEDKTKSHLRNALARFSHTKTIPAKDKPAVWRKLVAKCKAYGIHVTGESDAEEIDAESAKARTETLLAEIAIE